METWMWVVLWAAIGLAGLGLLGYSAFRTIRSFIRMISEFGDMVNGAQTLSAAFNADPLPARSVAVLTPRSEAMTSWRDLRSARGELRHQRRTARLDRARELTRATPPVPAQFRG